MTRLVKIRLHMGCGEPLRAPIGFAQEISGFGIRKDGRLEKKTVICNTRLVIGIRERNAR